MKKVLLLVLMLVSVTTAFGYEHITKFLGIPVDGTKSEMINKLKAKGFIYHPEDDNLSGEFNGYDVIIHVVTENNKVWRIYIADAHMIGEADIKIRFNNLVHQFSKKKNYISFSDKDYIIPQEEDISYGLNVKSKRYSASYAQLPNNAGSIESSLHEYLLEKFTEEEIADTVGYSDDSSSKKLSILLRAYDFHAHVLKSCVWFMVNELYGRYYISMFYDNENNHANGEDL